jgi:hypothetical protein
MERISIGITVAAAVALLAGGAGAAGPPSGPLTKCSVDAVVSGAGCMDKFEASVWRLPDPLGASRGLVKRIQRGRRPRRVAAEARELGIGVANYAPCADKVR